MKQHPLTTQSAQVPALGKCLLLGAAIALVLIALFLTPVKEPKPEWGPFWMVKPMIVVPLAGAIGGLFYHFIARLGFRGWKKVLGTLGSLLLYVVTLWLGTVLGLNGTLWN